MDTSAADKLTIDKYEQTINAQEKSIKYQDNLLKLILENIADGVVAFDNDGRFILLNAAAKEMLGTTEDLNVLKLTNTFEAYLSDKKTAYPTERMLQALTGEIVLEEEMFLKNNNEEKWITYHATPLRHKGEILGAVAVIHDITKRKLIEENLRENEERYMLLEATLIKQAAELARSNYDLEQFAYVASHDLQEPLRMVASYCKLLEKRYKDKLDTDGIEFINFAVEGARRMQQLISDLLQYSRVETKGKQPVPTKISTCLKIILVNLGEIVKETNAKIMWENMPEVLADETQIMQVFQNLIGNALKYRKDNVAPDIKITSSEEGGFHKFCIQDNGIGIDPTHKDRLFIIFQRLHNNDKYTGTGIGLAICRRIVERHGGKIWFESELGIGSKFYFTLKAAS